MNTSPDSSQGAGISPGAIVGGGHYSLHVPLGESGLLWLAQDEELQRLAVVRFLPAEIRQDVRALETLKKRVVAAGAVTHENVSRTLEWYESAAMDPFIATEYVEGKPVTEVMNGGEGRPIPWDWLKPVAASVACGLEALHHAGVVHHGVCPENILVAADKRVKLLDAVVTGTLRNPLFVPASLHRPRELRCFSPQQLEGKEPATADDFYSLGATLFELLTGSAVFGTADSLLQDIRSTPAPALRERLAAQKAQAVPDGIIDFIMACLSKDAAQRPKTLDCLLPRQPQSIPVAATTARVEKAAEKVVPVAARPETAEVLPQLASRSDLELIKAARDARPRRNSWALAAVFFLLLSLGGTWGFFHYQKQQKENQRMAAAALEEARQREQAEENTRQAEEKLKQETAARKKSEEETRKAREAARLAEERRRTEAEAQTRRERELAATQKAAAEPEAKKFVPPPEPSATTNGGFVSMFNGRDLTDWSGNTNHWSVRDGFITAQSKADDAKERHLLTWQKGPATDFEMHFSYRFRVLRGNKTPNGGVNYRLTGSTNPVCYQFDLVTNPKDNGSLADDRRRARIAGYGDAVTATSSNKHELLATLGDTNKLNAVKSEDWNRCVIIAQGNRLTHYINGLLVADVIDESKSKRHTNGAIALELYTRNTNNCATFLQFNDLKIKRLEGDGKRPGLISSIKP
jgi:serine/threonine protein kinase